MENIKVGFIGVGKLGQSCAEMIAEKYEVFGYDVVHRTPTNFSMLHSIEQLVNSSDIIFIAVQTPHNEAYGGSEPTSHLPPQDFDYNFINDAFFEVSKTITSRQTVILISTVLPGTIRRYFSKKYDFEIIYNPYLIAMGTVKWDMVNPEMIMIGTKNGEASAGANKLKSLYLNIMENNPRYVEGTWEEIECLKVFYNTFISAKVSLVNMIQDVAEKIGNINSELVCDALAQSTKRIMGPAYMKPGMGDGGACHPRDNIALRFMAKEIGLGYDLFDSVMSSREIQAENMAKLLVSFDLPVVIVGKAYKPLVEYTIGSSSMLVGYYVSKLGGVLYYFDSLTGDKPPEGLGPVIYLMAHCPEITYGEQISKVINFHESHKNQGDANFEHSSVLINIGNVTGFEFNVGSVVVDPWRRIPKSMNLKVIHYGNTRGDIRI
jgi:UDPglucose 6-dehydrogenase